MIHRVQKMIWRAKVIRKMNSRSFWLKVVFINLLISYARAGALQIAYIQLDCLYNTFFYMVPKEEISTYRFRFQKPFSKRISKMGEWFWSLGGRLSWQPLFGKNSIWHVASALTEDDAARTTLSHLDIAVRKLVIRKLSQFLFIIVSCWKWHWKL